MGRKNFKKRKMGTIQATARRRTIWRNDPRGDKNNRRS